MIPKIYITSYWLERCRRIFTSAPTTGKVDIEYFGEFGYELQLVLPYAYFLHQQGRLGATTGCIGTKELYYFSPNHKEVPRKRGFALPIFAPNFTPHVHKLDESSWIPPPLKTVYGNAEFSFDKPLYIVHNKKNTQWMRSAANYLSPATLDAIFHLLSPQYQIIYIRPGLLGGKTERGFAEDAVAHQFDNAELALIERWRPHVVTIQELLKTRPDLGYNRLQLLLHANADRFISVQGGNSVLASYFGGQNVILAKQGRELRCDAYNGHYRRYSGCDTHPFRCEQDMLTFLESQKVQ